MRQWCLLKSLFFRVAEIKSLNKKADYFSNRLFLFKLYGAYLSIEPNTFFEKALAASIEERFSFSINS